MLGNYFYNEAIRKTVVGFGTLFNNIELKKKNPESGDILEVEKVPLAYGPKQKFLTRLEQNPEVGRKVAIQLPRLYFELTGISYDPSRKTSPVQRYRTIINEDGSEVKQQYVPVPYNMEFELGIIAKNQDDGLQILEQILPFFQPNFNITINMVADMDEKKDVLIELTNINHEDDWEDDFLQRRSITWVLNFVAKSYIYGPYSQAGLIKRAIVYETVDTRTVPVRAAQLTYQPKAINDENEDGVVNELDTTLLVASDDFGFSEGIDLLLE